MKRIEKNLDGAYTRILKGCFEQTLEAASHKTAAV